MNIFTGSREHGTCNRKEDTTLKQFEKKIFKAIHSSGKRITGIKTFWAKYKELPVPDQQNEDLINAFRQLDVNVNVNWPLVHYKSAARYLHRMILRCRYRWN